MRWEKGNSETGPAGTESECMGTEGGLRARKLSGVTVRTWAVREGPLLAVECSRIRDGAGARAGWRSLHGESSWPWDAPSLSFSAGFCAKFLRGSGRRVPLRGGHCAGA